MSEVVESRIVVGVMSPMLVKDARIGALAQARGEVRALVDLDNARDIASRRRGPAADAAVGAALLKLVEEGDPATIGDRATALGKAAREIAHLAEGVYTGRPSAIAVQVANRLIDPAWVIAQSGEDRMDLVVLAYATLHLAEQRRMDGEVLS